MLDKRAADTAKTKSGGPPLDFQEHLARLEAAGLLLRIDRAINKDTELHPLVRWQFQGGLREDERRAFLFTNVVDAAGRRYDTPVPSARWPHRRKSMRSAWAARSKRSAMPGCGRSPIRLRP
jgi:hypothetical protein